MSQELIIEIATRTLTYTMIIGAPVLLTGLIIGVVLSILQSIVQIKEMTLTFIPKILAVMIILLLFMSFMINKFIEFFNYIMTIMQNIK